MAKAPNVLNTACQPYCAESPTPIPPRIPIYAYQRTYVLIPDLEYYALLYLASMYQIKSFKSAASGSIVKFITKGDIENIPVFIPDNKAILNKFNCLLMLQEQYQKESDELASIRDWLLPMLMNGQAAIED